MYSLLRTLFVRFCTSEEREIKNSLHNLQGTVSNFITMDVSHISNILHNNWPPQIMKQWSLGEELDHSSVKFTPMSSLYWALLAPFILSDCNCWVLKTFRVGNHKTTPDSYFLYIHITGKHNKIRNTTRSKATPLNQNTWKCYWTVYVRYLSFVIMYLQSYLYWDR